MASRWTPLGPSAIRAYVFDDSVLPAGLPRTNGIGEVTCILREAGDGVLVGTAGGGIWRRDGHRWRALTDGAPALAIGALARDPVKPRRLYAATGVAGRSRTMFSPRGVLVSQNDGETWSLALLPRPITEPRALLAFDEGVAFLVAPEGIFRTIDGGSQWTLFDQGGDSATIARDFSHGLRILLCRGAMLLASDGASAFQPLYDFAVGSNAFFSLAAAPGDHTLVHALGAAAFSSGGIPRWLFQSTNGGRDWRQVMNVGGDLPIGHPLKAFSGETTSVLPIPIAATGDDLSLLRVGLKHVWSLVIPANLSDGVVAKVLEGEGDPQSDVERAPRLSPRVVVDHGLDVYVGASGGLFRWDDVAEPNRWVPLNAGRGAAELVAGVAHVRLQGMLAAVSVEQGLFGMPIFSPAHPVWRRIDGVESGSRASITVADIGIRADAREWVAAHAASLAIAHDYTLLRDVANEAPWMRIAVTQSEPSIVYFGAKSLHQMMGEASKLLVEFDVANSAQEPIRVIATAPGSADVVWVALESAVVHGVASSGTFRPFPLPTRPAPDVPVSAVAVSPSSTERIYVGFGEEQFTLDARTTTRVLRKLSPSDPWEDLTANLPRTMPVRAIAVDPAGSADPAQERIVVAGDQGVFESRGGTSWLRLPGLPEIAVADLEIDPTTGVLRVFTVGRGAWELDPQASRSVALNLRAHAIDSGRRPLPAIAEPNPFARSGSKTLDWSDGAALKVDVVAPKNDWSEPSFQTSSAAIDFVDYGQLAHRLPRARDRARVFLEILERAPDTARNVTARIYWAKPIGGNWPDLPAGFWGTFPSDPPAGAWKPIGPAKTIAEVRPALPEIASWEWDVPADAVGEIGLLAIVTCPDDAIFAPMPLAIEELVRSDARVALRPTKVSQGPRESHRLRTIVGIATGILVVVGAYYAYERRDDIWDGL